ncbi:MAG: GNAT family N-acetyltransferase [Methyloglobulus sp.]|nr:GNAT family N-acetyltransferase [Methyloglobulus sp.]
MTYNIKIATTDDEIKSTFAVMHQLRPHLVDEDYVSLIKRLQTKANYTLVFLTSSDTPKAAMGFRVSESLVGGQYLYIDDLVTDENARSLGYGKILLDWATEYARESGCKELHLDSGVQRHDAHRFYLRERMDIVFYHFRKKIQA